MAKRRRLKDFFRYQWIRLHRLQDHPHEISLGVAFGVFVSFTPLLGLHLVLATLLCIVFGGSKIASWIGTLIGNPMTFPPFFYADHKVGVWLLRMEETSEVLEWNLRLGDLLHRIWPVLTGGIVLGSIAGVISYYCIYEGLCLVRLQRRHRMGLARACQPDESSEMGPLEMRREQEEEGVCHANRDSV